MSGPQSLADVLRDAAEGGQRAVALVDEPDQPTEPLAPLSALRAAALAEALAAGLDDVGVSARGTVALVAPNGARAVVAALGVPASSRVLLVPRLDEEVEPLGRLLRDWRVELVLTDPDLSRQVAAAAPRLPRLELGTSSDAVLFRFDHGTQPGRPQADDLAVVLPSGEQVTHGTLVRRADELAPVASGTDVWLHLARMAPLPLVVSVWRAGARQLMMRKQDGLEALSRVVEHQVGAVVVDRAAVWALLAVAGDGATRPPVATGVRMVVVEHVPDDELDQLAAALGWHVECLHARPSGRA